MFKRETIAALSLFALAPFALVSCDDGPAEDAGEAIDEAAEDTKDAIEDAADEIDDK